MDYHPDGSNSCTQTKQSMLSNLPRTTAVLTDSMRCRQSIPIDMLHDDVLLAIFDFYLHPNMFGSPFGCPTKKVIDAWQTLVHVCRRWRSIVFGSPRSLNLQLCCTFKTSVRDMLYIWPALPLFIHGYIDRWENVDNIISALNHKNRVCRITLVIDSGSPLNIVVEAMQEPFPELSQLTDLRLKFSSSQVLWSINASTLPDSFLGGSATRLRSIILDIRD